MDGINPSAMKTPVTAKKAVLRSVPRLKRDTPESPRFRIMPLTMTMLSLLLVVQLWQVYDTGITLRRALVADAAAESEASGDKGKANDDKGAGEDKDTKKSSKKDATLGEASEMRPSEMKALKKLEAQTKFSQIELDLLQNLAKRRDELDVREKELAIKERTLEAAEKRIADRVDEMKALQKEVVALIEVYKNHQAADVKSLVKIYENMKPGNAAEIFNELDMPILLSVIDAMSERKVAPVLAAMNPKRAKIVTEELAELRKVKSLPAAANAGVVP